MTPYQARLTPTVKRMAEEMRVRNFAQTTIKHIPFGKRPKKLPTVLGDEEVRRLLACVPFLKHRTVLTVCYAAGLRLSEAAHLKISDIDGGRSMIHIRSGKVRKDRLVPISPRLLSELREH